MLVNITWTVWVIITGPIPIIISCASAEMLMLRVTQDTPH